MRNGIPKGFPADIHSPALTACLFGERIFFVPLGCEFRTRGGYHGTETIGEGSINIARGGVSPFRQWFLEEDWKRWDEEIEEDSKSGKLDFLIREAREAKETIHRKCKIL